MSKTFAEQLEAIAHALENCPKDFLEYLHNNKPRSIIPESFYSYVRKVNPVTDRMVEDAMRDYPSWDGNIPNAVPVEATAPFPACQYMHAPGGTVDYGTRTISYRSMERNAEYISPYAFLRGRKCKTIGNREGNKDSYGEWAVGAKYLAYVDPYAIEVEDYIVPWSEDDIEL